jgi:MFS family permease
MSQSAPASAPVPIPVLDDRPPPPTQQNIARLTFYFGLVYFCQGVSQYVCLMNQPVRAYLRQVLGYNPQQIADFVFLVGLPWVIKPVYGLVSDFIPLFGYRRKSYLLLMNFVAAGAFMYMAAIVQPSHVLFGLFMTGVGVAASDVIVDAIMVEAGQETGRIRLFQGVQWLCINVASIGSGLLSMWIVAKWKPTEALRIAALIAATLPLVVAAMTWWAVRERRSKLNLPELKSSAAGLAAAFKSPRLWAVAGFIALTVFNPGLQTPMYDHIMKKLGVDESFNSIVDTAGAIGWTVASALFLAFMTGRFSTRTTIAIGLLTLAAGTVPYYFIQGKASALVASFTFAFGYMIASLATLSLAAEACPKRAEGFVFASLMSISNLSMNYSDKLGSRLYEGYLRHNIYPLITLSIGITLGALLILPFLPTKPVDAPTGHGFPVLPPRPEPPQNSVR